MDTEFAGYQVMLGYPFDESSNQFASGMVTVDPIVELDLREIGERVPLSIDPAEQADRSVDLLPAVRGATTGIPTTLSASTAAAQDAPLCVGVYQT